MKKRIILALIIITALLSWVTAIETAEEISENLPEAYNQEFKINKNTILTSNLNVKSNTEEKISKYKIIEKPLHGEISHNEATSDFTYTPTINYVGTDKFTYTAENKNGESNYATVTITIEEPKESTIPFYYVDMQNHWANYSASHLASRGILIGEEIANRYYFNPNQEITRLDFMLYLLALVESNEDANLQIPNITFSDEKKYENWVIEVARLAYAKGIIKGNKEGNQLFIHPYSKITKEEAVVMINNILRPLASTKAIEYSDIKEISPWAIQGIRNLTSYKILQGNLGKLNPKNHLTKAESAELIYKLMKELEKNETYITDIK